MVLPVQDDGGGPEAGSYTVLGQRPDIMVRSVNDVIDAMTITVRENRYGVVFSFTMPRSEWLGVGTQAEAGLLASWVQAIGGHEHVIGLGYTQDVVTGSALLRDEMVITVGTPNGQHEAEITWPLRTLNTPAAFQAIDDTYANLAATAALT